MKAIWKILIGTAAAAAVAPYSIEKDEETGEVKLKAATWSAKYSKTDDGPSLSLNLLPFFSRKDECGCEEEDCCCGCEKTAQEEDEEGITIEVETSPDEPEADSIPDPEEPRPEEA